MSHPWATEVQEHELPSGISVKLRPVRIHALVRAGVFNDAALEVMAGESEELTASMEAMAVVAATAMVEPKVVMGKAKADPDKGIFHVNDLPDDDLAAIFQIAQGKAHAATFRADGDGDGDGESGEVLEVPSE